MLASCSINRIHSVLLFIPLLSLTRLCTAYTSSILHPSSYRCIHRPRSMSPSTYLSASSDASISAGLPNPLIIPAAVTTPKTNFLATIWKFTRPHTIMGSGLSVLSVFLFASSVATWKTARFWTCLYSAVLPALFMNLYITGLNQVTDVEIDKINKPYLPIPAGDLSKFHGTLIVIASLIASLALAANQPWPLQFTLLSSAFLGTIYSMPPFRLKRFPLLAALCILVVRGSVVNIGFFLHAKSVLFNQSVPSITAGMRQFPECLLATAFFALFGLVIAIMKDVPDVKGDALYSIPTFSVTIGAKKVFRLSWLMLASLLTGTSILSAFSIIGSSSLVALSRLVLSSGLGGMAWDLRRRARQVETDSDSAVFSFYMHIWNVFYGCYLLLPLARL